MFIVCFHAGTAGAGYATVISQMVSAVLCLVYIKKRFRLLCLRREDLGFDWKAARNLLGIGLPMGFQFSIIAIGTMVVQTALNELGPLHIAAYSAAGKIHNIFSQSFPALGVAIATYVGQNKGAGELDRIVAGIRKSFLVCLIMSVACGAVVMLLGPYMVYLFASDANGEMIEIARQYFLITGWFYPALSLIFLYRNAVQGLGYGLYPFLSGILEMIARSVAVFILASRLGYVGICFADPTAWVCALIPLLPVYYWLMGKEKKALALSAKGGAKG